MIFPFRSSAIFRNRWIALLWAFGICLMASEVVDSVSGITDKSGAKPSTDTATAKTDTTVGRPGFPSQSPQPPPGPPLQADPPIR